MLVSFGAKVYVCPLRSLPRASRSPHNLNSGAPSFSQGAPAGQPASVPQSGWHPCSAPLCGCRRCPATRLPSALPPSTPALLNPHLADIVPLPAAGGYLVIHRPRSRALGPAQGSRQCAQHGQAQQQPPALAPHSRILSPEAAQRELVYQKRLRRLRALKLLVAALQQKARQSRLVSREAAAAWPSGAPAAAPPTLASTLAQLPMMPPCQPGSVQQQHLQRLQQHLQQWQRWQQTAQTPALPQLLSPVPQLCVPMPAPMPAVQPLLSPSQDQPATKRLRLS